MPKKVVFIISVILVVGTLCTVGIMYNTDAEAPKKFYNDYKNVTQNFDRTTVVTRVEEAPDKPKGPGLMPGSGGMEQGPGTSTDDQWYDQTTGLVYQGITHTSDGLVYQAQTSPYWSGVGSNTAMSSHGCFIFAVASAGFNKYGVQAVPGNQIEDVVMKTYPGQCTVNSQGYLECRVDKVGRDESAVFPSAVKQFYGVSYDAYSGPTDSKGWPTENGEYLVYYGYNGSRKHWMYTEVSNGTYKYGNSYTGMATGRSPKEISDCVHSCYKLK